MIAAGILFILGIAILFNIIILISNRRSSAKETQSQEHSIHVGTIDTALKLELAKLALPPEKTVLASKLLSDLLEREIQEKAFHIRKEIKNTYEQSLQESHHKMKEAEEKYGTISKNYERLSKEKKQTESVVRSLAEGLIVVDDEGQTLLVNPAAEKILRKKKEELIGKPILSIQSRERVISFAKKLEDSEQEAITVLSESDATRKIVRESSAVIENDSGQTRGMISVLPEATKFKEIDQCKEDFMAGVSHELRTPLICIQKSLAALIREELGGLSPKQKDYLHLARRNVVRLEKMVDDILNFAKMESGNLVLRPALFPLASLIRYVKATFRVWAEGKNIELTEKIEDDRLMIEADREQLVQVLTHLIANGLKFTPKNGRITVEAKIFGPREFQTPDRSPCIEVTVEDSGIGIPSEDQERIFEKFTYGSSASLDGECGTGLGLAIAKEIIELHGGHIWAESKPGKGSKFCFLIPQYQQLTGDDAQTRLD